jgi:hypothetical protein
MMRPGITFLTFLQSNLDMIAMLHVVEIKSEIVKEKCQLSTDFKFASDSFNYLHFVLRVFCKQKPSSSSRQKIIAETNLMVSSCRLPKLNNFFQQVT